jgi:two-component system chemotaxis response regulator CheY
MKTCLVVDHSPALRTVARRILEALDYAVAEAASGPAALGACRAAMPDLIFLDWNLPHMTGTEFVRALRRIPGGTHPRLLLSTTELDRNEIAAALAAGADEYVLKPFDDAQIRSKLTAIAA